MLPNTGCARGRRLNWWYEWVGGGTHETMGALAVRAAALLLATAALTSCSQYMAFAPDPRSRVSPNEAVPEPTRHFEHVLIIVLENQDYENAISDAYLLKLTREGASLNDFHGLAHPSYPNYLAMISGREIRTQGDKQSEFKGPTVGKRLLDKDKKLTWKNYAEGYPGSAIADTRQPYVRSCFLDDRLPLSRFARKHVPFLCFDEVTASSCEGVVPAWELERDLTANALPAYGLYTPNMDNDGHDPVLSAREGLRKASAWLQGFRRLLGQYPEAMRSTLAVVTFDESRNQSMEYGNHIYTVLLGDMIAPGDEKGYPGAYNHYNLLRTIEDNFGLLPLNTEGSGDSAARGITGVWKEMGGR